MFQPYPGYCEIEPLSQSELASDQKEFIAVGKVIKIGKNVNNPSIETYKDEEGVFRIKDVFSKETNLINEGDIIFFRPHGMFETPEYEGKKHYVVRVNEEFILGKYVGTK